jgi:hypothetical protein
MSDDVDDTDDFVSAQWPMPDSLADAAYVYPPHPATLDIATLQSQCRITAHRRGGPGGQHRNKVSSAMIVLHLSTNVSAEANERRDQSENRRVALDRLRLRLALALRTTFVEIESKDTIGGELRRRWTGRPLKINEANFDRAAVLALLLDDLHRAGGQPSLVATLWKTSTTSVVQFLAACPPAFQLNNRWRVHHGRQPLR